MQSIPPRYMDGGVQASHEIRAMVDCDQRKALTFQHCTAAF